MWTGRWVAQKRANSLYCLRGENLFMLQTTGLRPHRFFRKIENNREQAFGKTISTNQRTSLIFTFGGQFQTSILLLNESFFDELRSSPLNFQRVYLRETMIRLFFQQKNGCLKLAT